MSGRRLVVALLGPGSSAAIKAANPAAVVIAGGVFGRDTNVRVRGNLGSYKPRSCGVACPSTVATSGATYLYATYDMGWAKAGWKVGAAPFEHVGQHLYIDQTKATTAQSLGNLLGDDRAAYATYGKESGKQTHVTELGWPTGSVNSSVQANNLQTACQTLKTVGYVGRAYWYRTQDLPPMADSNGLVDANGGLKPAFAAFQRYAAY